MMMKMSSSLLNLKNRLSSLEDKMEETKHTLEHELYNGISNGLFKVGVDLGHDPLRQRLADWIKEAGEDDVSFDARETTTFEGG